MKPQHLLLFLIAVLTGCATGSSVVQDGLDGYRVTVAGKATDTPLNVLQSEAQAHAGKHCADKNLLLQIRNFEAKPPRQAGEKLEATLKFRCVGKPERLK
ncbi:MAG: hypothetical protein QM776_01160 [Rhodocyclaceae bacterium]